jgi:HlyD family secretion protein
MNERSPFNVRRSISLHLGAGVALVAFLVFGLGGWAATTELSGAVIASGQLVVESDVKKVQHPTGGVIAEIDVKEGDRVEAGQVVARLDQTQTRANLGVISGSLNELLARQARDEAERDGAAEVIFPDELAARADDQAVAHVLAGEKRLFDLERTSHSGQQQQLRQRVSQLQEKINGIGEQIASKRKEIVLIHQELDGVADLWKKNLIQIDRLISLQRESARTEGELGQLSASIAETKEKITETELQILQIDRDLQAEVGKDLGEIRAKISELRERRIAADDQLRRVDIRAPQAGFVHQLTVHTIGGVVGPQGEPLMLIVPDGDDLRVEARIQPNDIDQVRLGQKAVLRFTAFNARTTPELNGEVSLVGADVNQDAKSGANFYVVRIALRQDEIDKLGAAKLVPGMPVEVFIQTNPRTVISYLTRPVRDQIARAFREK